MDLEKHSYIVIVKNNPSTKKVKGFSETGKQHLLMFYFSLVKIYIIYITCREESHSLVQRKLTEKAHLGGSSFQIVFS